MIFKELVLENFGAYRGRQVLDLSTKVKDVESPIILIGGMNGGGKTTIMDAIRLALYGHRAQCSTRGKLSYSEFLIQCINRYAIPDEITNIELALNYPFKNQMIELRIQRSWNFQSKNGRDKLEVRKGFWIDQALTDTWDEWIENVFPLGISNLFLFDGEQVKELAEQDIPPATVFQAIRSLLGLELPDRLCRDLDIIVERKLKNLPKSEELEKIEELGSIIQNYQQVKRQLKQNLANITNNLERAKLKSSQAYDNFITEGGQISRESSNLEQILQQNKERVESHYESLTELLASTLPLVFIQSLLFQSQNQSRKEYRNQQYKIAKELLQEREYKIIDFLSNNGISLEIIQKLNFLLNEENYSLQQSGQPQEFWLNVDVNSLAFLNEVLKHTLPHQKKLAQNHLNSLEKSQREIRNIQERLEAAPPQEIYDKLMHEYEESKKLILEQESNFNKTQSELEKVKQCTKKLEEERKRIIIIYGENRIKNQDIEHLITNVHKVKNTLDVFAQKLKIKKLNDLEIDVTRCFLRLLHKSKLFYRIEINTESFQLNLYDYEGQNIPKNRLSAGEKQLLAIAFLWGLAKASGRQLPITIDTPLGRLDSSHRSNLIEKYFPEASHQVILLSTDTEIAKTEFEQLKLANTIAREYLLKHDNDKKQTSIEPGYFW